jgi:pimeloyl-ACP methyl ester carboxylesterase
MIGNSDRSDHAPAGPPRGGRLALLASRCKLTLEAALAPARVERRAADLFFSPQRLSRATWPTGLPPARLSSHALGRHRLPLWTWGPVQARTVLLAHGWQGNAAQLAGFVLPLLESGFRVAAFDQPAHGAAEGAPPVSVLDFREATARMIEVLGGVDAVIAHSLGATAVVLALANRAASGARLALLAPGREPEPFARRLGLALGLPGPRVEGMLRLIRREVGDFEALDIARVASTRSEPLLVVHDPADREVPFAGSAAIARAWPGARLLPVAGVGHRRILNDPNVIQHVLGFIARRQTHIQGERSWTFETPSCS